MEIIFEAKVIIEQISLAVTVQHVVALCAKESWRSLCVSVSNDLAISISYGANLTAATHYVTLKNASRIECSIALIKAWTAGEKTHIHEDNQVIALPAVSIEIVSP